MRNYQINQNERKAFQKQSSNTKIIVKSNGKISLSKSTQCCSEEDKKNHQINLLKKQIFELKCQLESEKTQNKKIAILSNEIRKVKQKLIRKVSQNHSNTGYDMHDLDVQKDRRSKQDTDLRLTVKEAISNREISIAKVSLLRDSTDQIFNNFSLMKSGSRKSSILGGDQTKLIRSKLQITYLDEIESMQSQNIIQSRLNDPAFKFSNRHESPLDGRTVQDTRLAQKFRSQPIFFNEFQQYELGSDHQLRPQCQKLSVANCINTKRSRQTKGQVQSPVGQMIDIENKSVD